MKKLIIFLCFLFGAIAANHYSPFKNQTLFAAEQQFARIKTDGVYIYSSPANIAEHRLFEIPKTYFAELLENANENFYKARYMEVTGYIKKEEVSCVKGIPSKPYANSVSFRVFVPNGLNLRSTPDSSSPFNILDAIPFLSTSLIFYGNSYGEESVSQRGNLWYYCKYLGTGSPQFGYVYSVFCDSLTTITPNTETFEEVSEPSFGNFNSGEDNTSPVTDLFSLPIEVQIAIIAGIILFSGLLLFLIIRPSKLVIKAPNAPEKLPKPKRAKKHADYYEFDEFDL